MLATEYDELDRELGGLDDERGARARSGGGGLRVLPIVVGVVSLLALSGIIWYAYTQGVREGSEVAAPTLRPDGEAKVEPDEPGGRVVAGTDMGIYDCVNGDCDTTPQNAEIILPRPEEPLAPPTAPPPAAVQPPPPPAETVQSSPPVDTTPVVEATTRAPVPEPNAPEIPANLNVPDATPPTAGTQTQEVAATAETAPTPTPPPAPPPAAEPTPPPAQTASAAGTGWRIQLAALKTDAAARSQWTKLQSANSDLLGSLALEVQQATVNGTEYFRVRGGPLASSADAKALCAKLKAKNVACIPVAPGR